MGNLVEDFELVEHGNMEAASSEDIFKNPAEVFNQFPIDCTVELRGQLL